MHVKLSALWLVMSTSSLLGLPMPAGLAADYSVQQITHGPQHHFFGYIGHVGTIPWNASGRYILALRVTNQDRLPTANDAAEIVLLDTKNNYTAQVVDRTCAWNLQQGTMLYWNPQSPETQFFFNDRDRETGKVFTVLFDISKGTTGERAKVYRFKDTPIGNSGVAQKGGFFLGINYGRLARLRPVTGYPNAWDWTIGDAAPDDDGIFLVNVETGQLRLLVSYAQLRDELRKSLPHVEQAPLFINHTLWNRDDDRILFYVRGNFRSKLPKIDVPFTIDLDGKLTRQEYIGGHPEWESGHTMIGHSDDRQVLYDTVTQTVTAALGPPGAFSQPGGDIALSLDGRRFVNGHSLKRPGVNYYTIFLREDNQIIRTRAFSRGEWTSGALRLDPAPCWNRTGDQILVPAIAEDEEKSRQLFLISIEK